ncbi:MAG TPA: hypothetical protein VFG67_04615 [Oleiagrimonas sp.]|nr:hypothetical protein [Oleiagrimonas sp.]
MEHLAQFIPLVALAIIVTIQMASDAFDPIRARLTRKRRLRTRRLDCQLDCSMVTTGPHDSLYIQKRMSA